MHLALTRNHNRCHSRQPTHSPNFSTQNNTHGLIDDVRDHIIFPFSSHGVSDRIYSEVYAR
ncbi:hypothetical protein BDZ89DRAFT_1063059 [Hymenopellis radicata]|nr:hypothetical protein BDZ89DRAFT_1063059 [Hymenopellis radicata]